MTQERLPASALRTQCDPESLDFESTDELKDGGVLGQERAVGALRFALDMRREGYNLFALGPAGLGKHEAVRELLEAHAVDDPQPKDWCYVHNFADGWKPRALALPEGRGLPFRADMQRLRVLRIESDGWQAFRFVHIQAGMHPDRVLHEFRFATEEQGQAAGTHVRVCHGEHVGRIGL